MLGFIHIPKCAGSSVKRWLHDNRVKHFTSRHLQLKEISSSDFETVSQWFTVVRNPFDRMISQYEFCFTKSTRMLRKHSTFQPHLVQYQETLKLYNQGFSRWLRNYHKINPNVLLTQSSYITDPRVPDFDFVFRFEDIENDWPIIQFIADCYEPLPHIKQTTRTLDRYFTEEDRDYVVQQYKQDFEQFGYSTDLI